MHLNQAHEDFYADEREEAQKLQKEQNQANEDRVRSWVYPLICNMGSFQTINNKKLYLANPDAGKALKKLSYEMWKPKELDQPFIRFYLFEWNFIKENLLPLIHTQHEDKKLLSEAMRLLWVMSADFSAADLQDFVFKDEFLKKRRVMAELLCNKAFIQLLVQEIEVCASAGEDILDAQKKMLRFIFGTILNLMRLEVSAILPKIVSIFGKDGGLFDSMIYLTQNTSIKPFRELYPNICLIIHRFLRFITPYNLFGSFMDKDPEFKRRHDLEKLMNQRRKRNVISSRHSRFGAMIAIKRSDKTSLIISNPNTLRDQNQLKILNQRQGQLKKRLYGVYQQSFMDKKTHHEFKNLKQKRQVDGTVIHHLKAFFKEFLNFGFDNMAKYLEHAVFSIEQRNDKVNENILVFIEFMTFVMESVLIMR